MRRDGRSSRVDGATRIAQLTLRARSWLSRALIALGAQIAILMAAGAAYQAVATRRDKRDYPAPGRMVDVGGHRLHLQIAGEDSGMPAAVLEAGLDAFSANWAWVQMELAKLTRVVACDRAGLGWSEPAPGSRDARTSALELHAALRAAGIASPYVLAGHSYGGLVARSFARLYPEEVVGMALVDASHPDQWTRIPASRGGKVVALSNRVLAVFAFFGVLRLFDILTPQVAAGLPARQYAEMKAILALPRSSWTGADTLAVWNDLTRPHVTAAPGLGSVPLAVLSVAEQPRYGKVLSESQSELPALSSNSRHQIVLEATHESLISQRKHALEVAGAIRWVLEEAGTGMPAAPARAA